MNPCILLVTHDLRHVRSVADKASDRLSPTLCQLSAQGCRPSITPVRLLLALMLQTIFGIRFERMLIEQLDHNPLFRWFVGL